LRHAVFFLMITSLGWANGPHVQPRIKKEEYKQRRAKLIETLSDQPLVLMGNVLRTRSNDTDYEFKQEPNFYYLTGINEPGAYLIVSKRPFTWKGKQVHELVFVQENNPINEIWNGKRLGVAGVSRELGLENVSPAEGREGLSRVNLFENFMKTFAKENPVFHLHTPLIHADRFGVRESYTEMYTRSLLEALQAHDLEVPELENPGRIEVLDPVLLKNAMAGLRGIKSEDELALLQKAVDISIAGHHQSLRIASHVEHEYQVEAAIEYAFHFHGAEAQGYNSIVGCGANGTILHYMTNRDKIDPSSIFCLDAGAEYQGYTADITRSFPADGTFTTEQRAIYEIVWAGQLAGAKEFRPGSTYDRVHAAIKQEMAKGLVKLGLIKTERVEMRLDALGGHAGRNYVFAEDVRQGDETLAEAGFGLKPAVLERLTLAGITTVTLRDMSQLQQLFPHGWGHPIGLDVHDPSRDIPFEKGMVWTIEPGIYIADRIDFPIPEGYMNIGIRIEDMYLITADGNRCLSEKLPRDPDQIEAIMKQKSTILPTQ